MANTKQTNPTELGQSRPKKKLYVGGIDRPFLIVVLLLLVLGTVMVFSASYPTAYATRGGDSYYFARRQIIYAALGVVAMIAVILIPVFDYHYIRRTAEILFVVSYIALVSVFFIGVTLNEAKRWLAIGPITVQPSEIVKFTLVALLAKYGEKNYDKIRSSGSFSALWQRVLPFAGVLGIAAFVFLKSENKTIGVAVAAIIALLAFVIVFAADFKHKAPALYYGVLPYVLLIALVAVPLYKQPHVSCIIIMAGIALFMMIASGTHPLYLFGGSVLGGGALLVLAKSLEHASGRLAVWRDPFKNILTGGWQPAQSLYAIGSGGIWGVGFGNSRQKFLYLPEPQNDYIFSIWCEEMGFVGAALVMLVFLFFIWRGIYIGLHAPDRFSSLLVIGIISHVALQMVLNIGVVTNTLPSTGISLPFFSYGGTSLIILLAEMGVVLSVSRYANAKKTI